METFTICTPVTLTLIVLIINISVCPVLTDSCTKDDLQKGKGAAVSDKETFGCRNNICDRGSNFYHVILQASPANTRWQEVEVNVKHTCVGSSIRIQDRILVLMSGVPVTWVLTGFKPRAVFLVGEGKVFHEYDHREIEIRQITVGQTYHQYLRRNRIPTAASMRSFIDVLQDKYFEYDYFGWHLTHVPVSINYAWRATSFTLTVGEGCCFLSPTIPWWRQKSTTTMEVPLSSETDGIGSSAGLTKTGIALSIAGIIGIVTLAIIISIVCLCCCRKGKRMPQTSTSQTSQNNVENRTSRIAGVSHLGAPQYPTVGPDPSAGFTGSPERPPPYSDAHSINPPSYSQVIRENNSRVEPSAPTLHM